MEKIKLIKASAVLVFLLLLIGLPLIAALNPEDISIKLDKNVYSTNDNIYANVTIKNSESNAINIRSDLRILPDIHAETFSTGVNLNPGETSSIIYPLTVVFETVPMGYYNVVLNVVENNNVIQKNASFQISGTKNIIYANVKTCQDSGCNDQKSVFLQGEKVYFKIVTNIVGLNVDGKVTMPDGSQENLVFSNYLASFQASHTGSYDVGVSLDKEGYETSSQNIQFAVIEKPAEINSVAPGKIEEYSVKNMKNKGTSYGSTNIETVKTIIFSSLIVFFLIILIILFIRSKRE